MMTGTKTNERPGTRAQVRHVRMSASKAREVLDLVRGLPVGEAADVLRFTERGASEVVARCLASAVANAQHNDEHDPETLYVSACYADEGPTLKRWRPRARGRATRIRKRMCHITIIVSPMPAEMAAKVEAKQAAGAPRRRRSPPSRRRRVPPGPRRPQPRRAGDRRARRPTSPPTRWSRTSPPRASPPTRWSTRPPSRRSTRSTPRRPLTRPTEDDNETDEKAVTTEQAVADDDAGDEETK